VDLEAERLKRLLEDVEDFATRRRDARTPDQLGGELNGINLD
jgi:hypothetical protein